MRPSIIKIRFQAGQNFSLRYNVKTSSGAHLDSYPMIPGFIPQWDVKNACSYASSPPYVYMAWCLFLHGQIYLTLNFLESNQLKPKREVEQLPGSRTHTSVSLASTESVTFTFNPHNLLPNIHLNIIFSSPRSSKQFPYIVSVHCFLQPSYTLSPS
jgi:hypothetical protein